jgi:hypothetical protein
LNDLILFGPVTLDNSYVTGISADGSFKRERRMTWNDYQFNMLKVQKLMSDKFDIASLVNNKLGDIEALAGKLGIAESAETD